MSSLEGKDDDLVACNSAVAAKPSQGKHAHRRSLRTLSTANAVDSQHDLLRSPIRHLNDTESAAMGASRYALPQHMLPSDLLRATSVDSEGTGTPVDSPIRLEDGSEPFRLAKALSVADLLSSRSASVDRQEVVDLTSGRVITQVPSLADLMDYDIDPSDLRPDTAPCELEGGAVGLLGTPGQHGRPRRPSSRVHRHVSGTGGVLLSPEPLSPPPTGTTPAPPRSARRPSSNARHRKLSVPCGDTSFSIAPFPLSLLGEGIHGVAPTPIAVSDHHPSSLLGSLSASPPSSSVPLHRRAGDSALDTDRPASPEPGRVTQAITAAEDDFPRKTTSGGHVRRSSHAAAPDGSGVDPVVARVARDVRMFGLGSPPLTPGKSNDKTVELKGRGVLVRQGSRPSSLYGNMTLVTDAPPTMSSHMLTFTRSRAMLGVDTHQANTPSVTGLELALWTALYGDGSVPSNSVVVDVADRDGTPSLWEDDDPHTGVQRGIPTSPVCAPK